MPDIDSEQSAATGRYHFSFSWGGPYGHVLTLMERLNPRHGVVCDIGCGFGAVAEPLRDRGYTYVGLDIDDEALNDLSCRGFRAVRVDLRDYEALALQLKECAAGQHVSATLLLDVIEHIPDTPRFLRGLRNALDLVGRPPLIVSVPNIAHVDIGAKLIHGHWDYRETGLLDATHLQFFTSARLGAEARTSGLLELDAFDFQSHHSDQHFPDDHPALADGSPIAECLRKWRELVDDHGNTVQFVRTYVPCEIEPARALDSSSESRPFLTVVMRTQGRRAGHLREALTCLAAQTNDDFVVDLVVHAESPDDILVGVRDIVEEFDSTFALRVRVSCVSGGDRARPLNVALDRLGSAYVAFLDDDDLVTANWVESFAGGATDGVIVRSTACVRHISPPDDEGDAPYRLESGVTFCYKADFDLIRHFWENETPICSFAVPVRLIETFNLRFDDGLPVLEDWDFLMRAVTLASVRDTREVTSIYQMWRGGQSSASLHRPDLWRATQVVLQAQMDCRPLVLPAGSVTRLVAMSDKLHSLTEQLRATTANLEELQSEVGGRAEASRLAGELHQLHHDYAVLVQSRRWRVMGPFARAVGAIRRATRRVIGR